MSLFSPLLIITKNSDNAQALRDLADALGYGDAQLVEGDIPHAVQALNARTSPPEYIIIDISAHDNNEQALAALDEFALHCEANVRVVVMGAVNDVGFYRQLKERGVLEYFTHPVNVADLRKALLQSNSIMTHHLHKPSQQGTVITCMSAASGDGSSTLATNLAFSLARDYKQPTVLVDLDYQFGLICKSLDLTAPFGIRELFDYPERGLDQMLIHKMLVEYRENLSIIASPTELRLLPPIRLELIRELIGLLRGQFAFVVLDVPHVWMDWTAAALTYSDHAVMVAQLWLRSLTHATRLLTAWQQIGIDRRSTSLVINRSGAKFKEAITAQDFERISRYKIEAYVGNDVKAVTYAENNAKTLMEIEQGALLQQQIRDIARSLMERYNPNAIPEEDAPRVMESKKSLLGLLEMGKKS